MLMCNERRKDIIHGGNQWIFPKVILGLAKSDEICFLPRKTNKTLFLLKFFNSCLPSDTHDCVQEKVRATALQNWYSFKRLNTILNRGDSSRRAAGLQPSLKNVRQKIPPNGQTRFKFGFSYENVTTQSFSVLPTPFRLNVSQESNKTNVSLLANDTIYAMTFSAHLPMNLAISGLSSAQP